MAQKQKAVVLFSGGVDSTTCLALAIERFGKENVVPLSIQYGQKHSKELEAAANVLAYYGIEGKTMDVTKEFTDIKNLEIQLVPTRNNKMNMGKDPLAPMYHLEMACSYPLRHP